MKLGIYEGYYDRVTCRLWTAVINFLGRLTVEQEDKQLVPCDFIAFQLGYEILRRI